MSHYDRIQSWLLEGERIAAKHDGVHHVHSVIPALRVAAQNTRMPQMRDIAERSIMKLRHLERTGSWPKPSHA